jgi:hypothetical protein
MRAEGFGAVWEYSVMQERRAPARKKVDRRRREYKALHMANC